ncbi:MAG: glycosyltransferase [Acidimicrobiia bacterium]|nr:glycosyltransferase [Acidimicrobiia bacterium]
MARIVLITSDTAGRVAIVSELANRLESIGHTTEICSPRDVSSYTARHGREYTHLPSGATAGDAAAVTRRLEAMEPDLILCDIELAFEVMAAYATGAPLVLWTSLFSVWKRPGLPPLHRGIVPGEGLRGTRIGMEWAWLRYRLGRSLGRMRRRLQSRGQDRISRLRTVAEVTGFPFADEAMLHEWLVPFAYRTLPVLVFNTMALEFPHEPHPASRYVGPVLSPVAGDELGETGLRLTELYERRKSSASTALVYCAFGAWHTDDDRPFLRRILAAAALRPDWDFVVGLGGRVDPGSLGEAPPNVHLFQWAPQRQVLKHADIAIHHGGVTSVNECADAGVPMLIYPFDFLDQKGNAARVAFHGLGMVGDRKGDSAAAILHKLDQLCGDESYRVNAARTGSIISAEQEGNRAIDAIVALLQAPEAT